MFWQTPRCLMKTEPHKYAQCREAFWRGGSNIETPGVSRNDSVTPEAPPMVLSGDETNRGKA